MSKEEIIRWLNTFPSGTQFAIDEGGLALMDMNATGYLEIGGRPIDYDLATGEYRPSKEIPCAKCGHGPEDHSEGDVTEGACWNGAAYGNRCECRGYEAAI